jgi:predicted permease
MGVDGLIRRLGMLLGRERFRSELDEEMAFHRGQSQKEFEAAGMAPKQARLAARRQFGNPVKLREQSHEVVGFCWESVWQDVRYAVRQFARSSGFTLAVVLTLALGIGVNTAIFSLVHATLLRQPPYPQADRILSIEDDRVAGSSSGGLTGVPRFFDLKARNNSFDSMAFFYFEHPTLIAGTRLPENVDGVGATGQFWRVFGAQPLLGRGFDERDDRPKAPEVVVLSYAAWHEFFGANPNAIGSVITIDKLPTTVIGVMPREFNYPAGNAIWRPTHFGVADWTKYRGDGVRFARVFGRLKPDISLAAAQSELRAIGSQLQTEYAQTDAPWQFQSESLRDYQYGALKPALLVLLAASAMLLLIACINVANLLLSRATARHREVALRQALGASRARLIQQYLTESLLLTWIGGSVGLTAALILIRVAGADLPGALHQETNLPLDWPVVWFALGVSALTGLAFGLAPAFNGRTGSINSSLKQEEHRTSSQSGGKMRDIFVSVQMGLSLVLLVGACLMVQSLWKLTQSPLGFRSDHVLTFQIKLPWSADQATVNRFYDDIQRRLEQLPGVTAVGQISALPTEGYNFQSNYDADWLPRTPHQDAIRAEVRTLAGNYLSAMGIPVPAGRELRSRDKAVLVNQEFVRQYLKGESPLGRHLRYDKGVESEIVGVVGDVRGSNGSLAGKIQPEVYFAADGTPGRSFVVRSLMPTEQVYTLTHAIREQVHEVDPQQAVANVRTLDEMLSVAVAEPRLNMALLVAFAAIALLLACVGIYGVVAYSVAQRRQEIGVRMALGATRKQISLLFLRRTLTAALIGLACGGVATLMVTRLLRSQLYGVEPNNPMTFLIAILLLLTPVLAASLRPALQAASVDPVEALRAE